MEAENRRRRKQLKMVDNIKERGLKKTRTRHGVRAVGDNSKYLPLCRDQGMVMTDSRSLLTSDCVCAVRTN